MVPCTFPRALRRFTIKKEGTRINLVFNITSPSSLSLVSICLSPFLQLKNTFKNESKNTNIGVLDFVSVSDFSQSLLTQQAEGSQQVTIAPGAICFSSYYRTGPALLVRHCGARSLQLIHSHSISSLTMS